MWEGQNIKSYNYKDGEREFVNKVWDKFRLMWQVKTTPLAILGNRTLQEFWDNSNADYAVLTEPSLANDPVTQYSSTISRDKADVFIAQLTKQLMIPSVTAFNSSQEIDRVMSRVGRATLEWSHLNDGFPTENGHQKMTRYIHKGVVEGTYHVQDDYDSEGLESSLVPNEEIFIPNFWQPNLQKQGMLVRAQLNVTYDEAEEIYGGLPNWKFVRPGFSDWWFVQRPLFKSQWEGIMFYEKLQILHTWINLSHKELEKEKKSGRLPKNAKRAKYYNIFINDIPMFPVGTLCPYKDGLYPISKGIFCKHSKPEFYWGNSLPNKIRQDKRWLDGWKTLLRYKAKLNVGRPLQSLNGQFVDEEIIVPFKITPVTEEIQLKAIEGVGDPVSTADVQMYEMAKSEIDDGTKSPQTEINPNQKVTNAVIMENNAKILLDAFALEVSFFVQARTYPILLRAFQFLPRRKLELLSVPDQKLRDGTRGTMELIFKKLPKMTKEEKLEKSFELLKEEKEAKKEGNSKEITYVDVDYLKEINLYLKNDPDSVMKDKGEIETQRFNQIFPTLLQRPDLFNEKEAARELLLKNELDDTLINSEQPMQQMAPTQPGLPGQAPQRSAMPSQMPAGMGQMQQLASQLPQLTQNV